MAITKGLRIVFGLLATVLLCTPTTGWALSIDQFYFRDSPTSLAASIEWNVGNNEATFSITPTSAQHTILSFAFNTTDQQLGCGGCPLPPPSPMQIDDTQLTVTAVGLPGATVRLGGTDHYDWDMFAFSAPTLNVLITNVPSFATDSDFYVRNVLVEEVYDFSGEFGVAIGDVNGNFLTWAYTNPGSAASVPEPSTLLLLGSGLVGLTVWRWKQAA